MSRIRMTYARPLRRNFALRCRQPATESGADLYDASCSGSLRQNRRLQFHRLLVAVAGAADEFRVAKRSGLPEQECDYRERTQPLQRLRRKVAVPRLDCLPFFHNCSAAPRNRSKALPKPANQIGATHRLTKRGDTPPCPLR